LNQLEIKAKTKKLKGQKRNLLTTRQKSQERTIGRVVTQEAKKKKAFHS